MKQFFTLLLVSLLSAVSAVLLFRYVDRLDRTNDGSFLPSFFQMGSSDRHIGHDFSDIAGKVTPCVANIKATVSSGDLATNIWQTPASLSTGSGVVISPDGFLVTNRHVVDHANLIEVTLSDRRTYTAKLIGDDQSSDLALLQLNAFDGKLASLDFANSDELSVGEWVLAVGNPFNLASTVTAGIVSAKGRNMAGDMSVESFIQTDAVVNPGNSGGALVNTHGKLVGINTAILTRSGTFEGYSFAVPSNLVKKVVRDLRDYGSVQRAYMGIVPNDVTPEIAHKISLPNLNGIFVFRVWKDGAADQAGMREGDVLVSISGVEVHSVSEYQEQIAQHRPSDVVEVMYIRAGRQAKVKVTLKNQNNDATNLDKAAIDLLAALGIDLRDLTDAEKKNFKSAGAMVTSIQAGSKVARTNIAVNFIITKVNGVPITSRLEAIEQIQMAESKVQLDGYYPDYQGNYAYSFVK